jgi:hypothetical protein
VRIVDKDALARRIKSDQTFGGKLTDAQAGRLADVVVKYTKAEDIQKYIDKSSDLPVPPDDQKLQATKDIQDCLVT